MEIIKLWDYFDVQFEKDGLYLCWPVQIPAVKGRGTSKAEALLDMEDFLIEYASYYYQHFDILSRTNRFKSEAPHIKFIIAYLEEDE